MCVNPNLGSRKKPASRLLFSHSGPLSASPFYSKISIHSLSGPQIGIRSVPLGSASARKVERITVARFEREEIIRERTFTGEA